MTPAGRRFFVESKHIVDLAGKYRLPVIYPQKEYVDEGGLMFYGADLNDLQLLKEDILFLFDACQCFRYLLFKFIHFNPL